MKEIKLTQGKVALVDDEDFEYLNQWKWHAFKSGAGIFYARRYDCTNNVRIGIPMHRLILNLKKGDKLVIDHKDGNGLNNQRSNVRVCTQQQNSINRKGHGASKYIGVSCDKRWNNKWRASIKIGGKQKSIGYYKTEENAAIAYNIFAEKHHGEFARYNTATI